MSCRFRCCFDVLVTMSGHDAKLSLGWRVAHSHTHWHWSIICLSSIFWFNSLQLQRIYFCGEYTRITNECNITFHSLSVFRSFHVYICRSGNDWIGRTWHRNGRGHVWRAMKVIVSLNYNPFVNQIHRKQSRNGLQCQQYLNCNDLSVYLTVWFEIWKCIPISLYDQMVYQDTISGRLSLVMCPCRVPSVSGLITFSSIVWLLHVRRLSSMLNTFSRPQFHLLLLSFSFSLASLCLTSRSLPFILYEPSSWWSESTAKLVAADVAVAAAAIRLSVKHLPPPRVVAHISIRGLKCLPDGEYNIRQEQSQPQNQPKLNYIIIIIIFIFLSKNFFCLNLHISDSSTDIWLGDDEFRFEWIFQLTNSWSYNLTNLSHQIVDLYIHFFLCVCVCVFENKSSRLASSLHRC